MSNQTEVKAMGPVERGWLEFRREVLGIGASADEVAVAEVAYYAGWASFMRMIEASARLRPEEVTVDFTQLRDELDEFGRLLLKRRHEAKQRDAVDPFAIAERRMGGSVSKAVN